MKMEHPILARVTGVVTKVFKTVGDQVTKGEKLAEVRGVPV
jgi:biotin carboxyl carrier protein